ncbi:hypothetical protein NHP21005_09210 [Helicobacter sp. NHP21005]|uniref:hypothetical protein n=1 Tax=Helicobacter felistomachi TaxID=3040201 RepID=UPI0025742F96|nr:hypothetical protein [Helicobacter sp. NHP21005]BEG57233.1 hypothetical protein NHP21005_09210 [Helicobacter sp. NHP21005]
MQTDNNTNSQQANLNQAPATPQTPLDNGAELENTITPFEIEDILPEPEPIQSPEVSTIVANDLTPPLDSAEFEAKVKEITKENEGAGFVNFRLNKNKKQLKHNTRKLPPSYLLPKWANKLEKGSGVISTCTAEQAHKAGEKYILECIETYERTKHPKANHFSVKKNFVFSMVFKIPKDITIERIQALMDRLNAKYGWLFYMGSIHNDEGHIKDYCGCMVKNRHAHLEFIALDKDTGTINFKDEIKLPKFKRALYTEICEFLGLTPSPNLGKAGYKRKYLSPREYAEKKAKECSNCKSKQEQIDILREANEHDHTPQGFLEILKRLIETKASTLPEAEIKGLWQAYELYKRVFGVEGDIQPQESGSAKVIAYQQEVIKRLMFHLSKLVAENKKKNLKTRSKLVEIDKKDTQIERLENKNKRLIERITKLNGWLRSIQVDKIHIAPPPATETPKLKPLSPIPNAFLLDKTSGAVPNSPLDLAMQGVFAFQKAKMDKLARLIAERHSKKPSDYRRLMARIDSPQKPDKKAENTQELHTIAGTLNKALEPAQSVAITEPATPPPPPIMWRLCKQQSPHKCKSPLKPQKSP